MTILFDNLPVGYSYEDLLLRPQLSYVNSRQDVDLRTEILPGVILKVPILAAPMSTICEWRMCKKMYEIGGLGILHRFSDIGYLEEQLRIIRGLMPDPEGSQIFVPQECTAFSIGIKESDHVLLERLAPLAGIVCIDVNVGHHIKTLKMLKYIKENYPHLKIIAGNVSTFEGAEDLCKAGADCLRATNGGGSACTTLNVTGVGVPTATSLRECVEAADQYNKTVIADGGLDASSKMVIALALGADAVMTGGLLSGSSCCPEHAFFTDPHDGIFKAHYFGMASRTAQEVRGGVKIGTTPEGITKIIPPKGKTRKIVEDLVGGIRSGMSMCNASNLAELRAKAQFMIQNSQTRKEK